MTLNMALALLVYPGLALALALALLFGWLLGERPFFTAIRLAALWRSFDGALAATSLLLAAIGLALLPWPYHPAAGSSWIGSPLATWAALESAFLLPPLAALLAPALGARAAVREAQIGVAGRSVIWLSLGIAFWAGVGWTAPELPARVLAGLAALLALPAALGIGPFRAETSLAPAGAEDGLDEATTALVRFARLARGTALLAAVAIGSLPAAVGVAPTGAALQLTPWIALLLIAAVFVVSVLAIRQLSAALPRLTLPGALRWCWWRALPLALVGLVYLVVV
jgi:hypothetical protein